MTDIAPNNEGAEKAPALETNPESARMASVWVTLALMASAIEPLVVKVALRGAATPFQLLTLKLALGGIFIAPAYRQMRWIGWPGVRSILAPAIFFIATNLLTMFALAKIPAVALITIITTTPAVVALINQFRGREEISRKFIMGFFLAFLGVMLSIEAFYVKDIALDGRGVLWAVGAVAGSALYRTKMDRITRAIAPITVSGYLFLINGLVGLFLLPWLGEMSSTGWTISFWIALVGAVANIAFLSALKILGSTRLSVLTVLQRPLAIVIAALVLREPLGVLQIVGIFFVLLGVHWAKVKRI